MKKIYLFFKKIIIRTVTLSILVYLGFGLVLFVRQKSMIYYPDAQDFDSCSNFSDAKKIVYKKTRMYYKNNSNKLVVFYHGNAGSACDRVFWKNLFEDLNYSYLFVEYTGYSGDDAKPSKELILQDVINANEFIENIGYSKVFLVGESLGTGATAFHSTLFDAEKILLISPFSQMVDVAQTHYSIYPAKWLLQENYDNVSWLRDYDKQLMIIHGANDKIIPSKFSKTLFNSIKSVDKEYVEIKDLGHNNLYGEEEVVDNVLRFLE